MRKLPLSIAIGNYDRVRPLMDGTVLIDGVDPVFLNLDPEEIFFRAFRTADFDVCELSLSSFAVKAAAGTNPYVGIPVFPSRMFRHGAIYVRQGAGIERPEDLKGRRIGTPEYQLTACVWARIILSGFGVEPRDIRWVRGGQEQPGRIEKIDLKLPADVQLDSAPAGSTLLGMLESGELDGLVSPRVPLRFGEPGGGVEWLFRDPVAAGEEFFRRTGIFPIMHVLGIKRELAERNPWLPAALLKAFTAAKDHAVAEMLHTHTPVVSLPFLEESVRRAATLMGDDYWSYGLDANRHVLDTFLEHHHAQGLSSRRLEPVELFHPNTLETFKI